MKRFILLMVIALLTGCAQAPFWTMTDEKNRIVTSKSFQFKVADGWVRTTKPVEYESVEIDGQQRPLLLESMTVTRDGTDLHVMSVTRRYPDNAFPTLKKKSNPNMLPLEAADLYVSELRKRTGLERLTVLSNKPAKIDNKPGFQLVMQYKNDDGLRIQLVTFGFVDKTGFYTINYRAPYLYYFERDYKDYMNLVNSFRQQKGAFDPPPQMPGWVKLFT